MNRVGTEGKKGFWSKFGWSAFKASVVAGAVLVGIEYAHAWGYQIFGEYDRFLAAIVAFQMIEWRELKKSLALCL